MSINRPMAAAFLCAAALLTAGCGTTTSAQSHAPSEAHAAASVHADNHAAASVHADNPAELADFIRATVHYDYEPVKSPAVLRKQADVAVVGTVASVDSALQKTDAENTGVVLVSLKVEETWKRDAAGEAGLVTYVIPRPTNIDAGVYRDALPVGTRIALFGTHAVESLLTEKPVGVVYDPAPQGLIFETGPGRAVNVWGEEASATGWRNVHSIAELRSATLSE